ncbi:50S ribosomal protein L29 [Candidatus Woesearchaeota archaeon]|nr:50S ribosomal protein L29 [Candidatus Woesearchaeota archaeon]MBI2660970.1 50S ribosomal protein L29 [Candidatus Woesearchaeota archaeon]
MSDQDIHIKLMELKKELMKSNAKAGVSAPKSPGKIKYMKRMVSRIMTLTDEKSKSKKEVKK